MKTKTLLLVLSSVLCPLASAFAQGSLTPPGAPASTFKTLQQIEPRIDLQNAPASAVTTTDPNYNYIINQPGSYYLTGNLGVTKPSGIRVDVGGVVIDLNGFNIRRDSGSGGDAITMSINAHRSTIKNGTIGVFGTPAFAYGVRCETTPYTRSGSLVGVSVVYCTTNGFFLGDGWNIESCTAHNVVGTGIQTHDACVLTRCASYSNSGAGIVVNQGATMTDCTASNNGGFYAIDAASGSTLTNCAALSNHSVSAGINVNSCTLSNCAANNNQSPFGIVASQCSVINCSALGNFSSATESYGIYGNDSTITSSTANFNQSGNGSPTGSTGGGIYAAQGTAINCTAHYNKGDGIQTTGFAQLIGNNCTGNGNGGDGAGIHVTGAGARVEANNVISNTRGIDVDVAGNFIVRNTAHGNGANYAITGTQTIGPIITATGTIATTSPWANFEF